MRHATTATDPHLSSLAELSDIELEALARTISERKRQKIASLSANQIASYADDTHEYGVTFRDLKKSTQSGRLSRLSDPDVWVQKIRQSADEYREHQAALHGLLGRRSDGLQPYCTDESLQRFIARKSRSRKSNCIMSVSEALKKSYQEAGKIYLMAKSLAENARNPDFVSLFITFTCAPKYHSSSKSYAGYSIWEAHKSLDAIFSSLIKQLSKEGKAGTDFFGSRGVELHEDGCPHWHVSLYIKSSLENLVIEKLRLIYNSDKDRPAGYFDKNIDRIIKKKRYDDPGWCASISYIFKSAFAWRSNNPNRMMSSLRQKVAISFSSIRQFQIFGACGRTTKIKEIWKEEWKNNSTSFENHENPGHTKQRLEKRIAHLNRTRTLIAGDADNYQLIKEAHANKHGEICHRICGISRQNQGATTHISVGLSEKGGVSGLSG